MSFGIAAAVVGGVALGSMMGGGDAPPPPDYTPVADASEKAAEISAQLGREQLAEGRRQYDNNMAVAKPVVDAQLQVMQQGLRQGDDYYEYGKSFRPLEQQMLGEAAAGTAGVNAADRNAISDQALADAQALRSRTADFEGRARSDIDLATGGNAGIVNRFGADIENDVGTAVADARTGQTQAMNSALRQAMRYGMSVPSNAQALTNQNAAQLAAAANNTRNASINNYRNLVAQGIGLNRDAFATGQAATTDAMNMANQARSAGRNMKIQDQSLDWARKLDVTGMARGMPGASQGAYGVAVGAGNAATQNQMAPGQALMGAMGQSAGTQLSGQQMALGGLGNILNAQTGYAGTVAKANSDRNAATMDMMGTAAGLMFSDARMKRDVVKVADDPRGFGWYEFEYVWGGGRQVGVMAQEIERVMPHAVVEVAGYKAVDYGRL
jgi:hypothetical protein